MITSFHTPSEDPSYLLEALLEASLEAPLEALLEAPLEALQSPGPLLKALTEWIAGELAEVATFPHRVQLDDVEEGTGERCHD